MSECGDYKYSIEVELTVRTPEGSPQKVVYRQGFLTNEELLQEQAALVPKIAEAIVSHGVETVSA